MKSISTISVFVALAIASGQFAQAKGKKEKGAAAPANPEAAKLTQEARDAAANKDWNKAIELYTQAMKHDQKLSLNLSIAYQQRAFASAGEQKFPDAIKDFSEAIKLTPREPRVYEQRAAMEIKTNELDKALADYSEAIKLNPNEVQDYNYRAYLYELKSDLKKSMADTEKALKLDPQNSNAMERKKRLQIRMQAQTPP